MGKQTTVSFNVAREKAAFDRLVEEGLTSQAFPEFVRGAFHERVDRVRLEARARGVSE